MSEQPGNSESPQTPVEAFQAVLERGIPAEAQPEPEQTEAETPEAEPQELQQESVSETEEERELEEEESSVESYRLPMGSEGEEIDISKEDLKNYVLRQEDYTRKTQAIAEERRQLGAERDSIRVIRETQAALESELGALRSADPVEPDQSYWDQLKTDNPMQWMIERQEWTERRMEKESTEKRYEFLQEQLGQQQHLERQQRLADEQLKLVERVPSWADETLAQNERAEVRSYGLSRGFSESEMNDVYDARAVEILRKAMRYDQLQEKRGSLKKKALALPASAGAAGLNGNPKGAHLTKAKAQLARTQSRDDARAAFQALLETRR